MLRYAVVIGMITAIVTVASGAALDEAVTIRQYTPKVGDRVQMTEEASEKATLITTVSGKRDEKVETKGQSRLFVQEVLTGSENGTGPRKLKRTYTKFETSFETNDKFTLTPMGLKPFRETTKHALDGKTLLIERKGEQYHFATSDGKAIPEKVADELNREFKSAGGRPLIDGARVFLPTTPVRVGDMWKLDVVKLLSGKRDDDFQFDLMKSTASAKLAKVYLKDGKQFGVIEVTVEAPIKGIKDDVLKMKVKSATVKVTVLADLCIDGTDPSSRTEIWCRFLLVLTGDDLEIDLDAVTTRTLTEQLLPKK